MLEYFRIARDLCERDVFIHEQAERLANAFDRLRRDQECLTKAHLDITPG